MSTLTYAQRHVEGMFLRFANTISEAEREDFFHPCEQDRWVPAFCEWLAEQQEKSAAVRASNG